MYIQLSRWDNTDIGHRVDRPPVNFAIRLDWRCRVAVTWTASINV